MWRKDDTDDIGHEKSVTICWGCLRLGAAAPYSKEQGTTRHRQRRTLASAPTGSQRTSGGGGMCGAAEPEWRNYAAANHVHRKVSQVNKTHIQNRIA